MSSSVEEASASSLSTKQKKGSQQGYLPTKEALPTAAGELSITFEDIARYPGRAFLSRAGAPTKIGFGPDNESLVYLGGTGQPGSLTQQLWKRTIVQDGEISADASNDEISVLAKPPEGVGQEDTLSEEEKLRRERTRQLETGITNFEYSENKKVLLCPIGNDLFVQREGGGDETDKDDGGDDELVQIVDSLDLPGSLIDPHISADGSIVGFVCDKELYVASTTTNGPPLRMTFDADHSEDGNGVVNGLADFIAMEEMGRNEGFWISPDSQFVAFEQSDESHIPNYKIMHQGQADPSRQEDHRYPFAGEANPKAKIGILSTKRGGESQEVRWLDIHSVFGEDMYLARVQWGVTSPFRENQHLYVQVMNREQTELVLLRFDIAGEDDDGEADGNSCGGGILTGTELIRETAKEGAWHNLHESLIPLKSGGFVWASESENGFRHLYLHDGDGTRITPITRDLDDPERDRWMVDTCTADMINQERDTYYFTGTKDGAKESHLYCTSIDQWGDSGEEKIRRITPAGGVHMVLAINTRTGIFVDAWSSVDEPHKVAVRSLADGSILRMLHDGSETAKLAELSLPPPEWFDVDSTATNSNPSSKDPLTLHGAIYKPDPALHGDGPYPAVVSLYGGPHAQMVTDGYGMTVDLRAQRLRAQGYVVIKVDNRGSARRGLDFETAIRHDMGNLEVEDQVEAVKHWVDKGLVDPSRVGVYGWSYGGYMSAMCLAKRPDVFSAAVAGAMVSSWDGYDTCYTERYMGTPQSNPDGYARSEVMPYVDRIEGSLLLVHGLIDENVHFRHTARLVNALIKARKHYELLLFPDERHVPRGLEDKVFMEERISSFLERSL
jgi:dipeptidyl-peptidase-4